MEPAGLINHLSANEVAATEGCDVSLVRKYCREQRVVSQANHAVKAVRFGGNWLIPLDYEILPPQPQPSRKLMLRITAPDTKKRKGFVAGIERSGRCPPMLGFMRGWSERQIVEYCTSKGWTIEYL